MTVSSGRSRPSGRSALTKWDPALEPPEGFATEGRGHPKPCHAQTDDCHAAAAAEPPHGLALGSCGSETSGFLKESRFWKQWAVWVHWTPRGGCSLLCVFMVWVLPAVCIHGVPCESGSGFLLSRPAGADASDGKTDDALNWSAVLFPFRLFV